MTNRNALSDDVLQNIYNREALIERLEKLHQHQSNNQPTRQHRVQRLLYGIHNASLAVVEAIAAWNIGKQDDWCRIKNIEIHASSLPEESTVGSAVAPCPFNIFLWNGQNYLQKMLSDLDFVGDIAEAISLLGSGVSFHRNPFLLPLGVDALGGPLFPDMKTTAWKDVNMQRIRHAAFVVLLDENYRKDHSFESNLSHGGDEINCLRHDAIVSANFRPPKLDVKDLVVYTNMDDPPAVAAVAICCAHLVLGSVDADVIDKLIYLTKPIVLKIFRQSLNGLVHATQVYNPLQPPGGNVNIIKVVYPFIMHQKMDSPLIVGISDQIVFLAMWLRALVTRLMDEDISCKASNAADRIFRELEAGNLRGGHMVGSSPKELCRKNRKEGLPDDSNKENQCTCKNVSVQTDEMSANKQKSDSSERILKTILCDVIESKELVPFPVAITVNLKEGSPLISANGSISEAKILKSGDVVRIYDAYESSNWAIANSPSVNDDGSIIFRLGVAYDHSRIVAQEAKARYDTLNRLCYPYRKDADGAPIHKPPEVLSANCEQHIRHVASDANESIHSPLYIKEALIWKLVPEDEDTRAAWRRKYDDGVIPWENDNAGRHSRVTHFRVRVGLEMMEQNCVDSLYPLNNCVHQQRVNFFESVPLSCVIDEAFHNVCRWHPKGTLIDNVKWAKLSRKMKFLSNVKNSNHEIDMAFVRHNQDRKLDLARFHNIFEDIASIQYPALTKEDALSKVVWASIVMLPDVNTMMWKEAKRMAIGVEAKRVCAQIRISALVRSNLQQEEYLKSKQAAIVVAKHVRQFLARIFVSRLLKAMRENEEYQRRWRCAKVVQTAWRRFFWRNRFILHQERRIEEKRKAIAVARAKLRDVRERDRSSIVFRDVIRIDSTIATVTISFRDESYLQDENSMQIKVYVPTSKETFAFSLEETVIRECLEKALSSEGRLSWSEMLKENALKELTTRLMLRVVRGRPIFLFSRRNIVEKGLLVDKRVARAVGELFILSTFRSPHDFVFYTYQPSTRLQLRTKLSMAKLREWLSETRRSSGACGKQKERQSKEGDVCFLDPKRQTELIEWLVKRVVIRKNPQGGDIELLLQFEAEEERVIKLIIKVQAQWRRLKSLRCAKERTIHQYEKIYVRENNMHAYRNMLTDERQWEKPKLLGDDDLSKPVDEWRKEETHDPATGQKCLYYANYATGQSSWLSEEDAARMVQRRYRSKHESDLLGNKIQLPDIVKAMTFIHGTRTKYEQDPNKLSNRVNFALLVHCLDLDFSKAKPIYEKALQQSPNHPLIARAYGIFLLASRQSPHATTFQYACRLFHEANVADPSQAKFQSATEIYFRWAVLVDAKNPLALLNYALLHQCIYKKYDKAEKIYRAALSLDPTNTYAVENYRLFTDERYPGGAFASRGPPFSVVRRSQVVEERLEWAEWKKMIDPECPRKGMEIFWFNRFTKETLFHENEPNWELVWESRMGRSRCISGKTSNWVEYWDDRTQTSFFFDVYTKQYTCIRPK
ncbi:hypothetical protein ACHAXR_009754 [Thalassiosira sp. AJA248-18]